MNDDMNELWFPCDSGCAWTQAPQDETQTPDEPDGTAGDLDTILKFDRRTPCN